mmetsp:Transcript_45530/g.51026  ORF Transcript_45530/g.51026 Transcript_45530/m.51026 type:complete len:261 (+) Transcript_45530:59-841(+)
MSLKHPSQYTKVEVHFFLISIGLESKCDKFDEEEIDGALMVTLTKEELEVDLKCTNLQIRKFTANVEFAISIAEAPQEEECTCKPPKEWSEAELCIFLVAIGLCERIEEFRKQGVNGSIAITLTKAELEQDLGMSSIQIKKFHASIEVTTSGGGLGDSCRGNGNGNNDDDDNYTATTYPVEADQDAAAIVGDEKPTTTGTKRPVIKNAAVGAAGGAAIGAIAGKLTGDTKKGAKIGAAVGGAGGIIKGLGERRRQRRANR